MDRDIEEYRDKHTSVSRKILLILLRAEFAKYSWKVRAVWYLTRCRLGAAWVPPGCRPSCRSTPLLAAIRRCDSGNLLIFLGFGFYSQAEGRGFNPRLPLQENTAATWDYAVHRSG